MAKSNKCKGHDTDLEEVPKSRDVGVGRDLRSHLANTAPSDEETVGRRRQASIRGPERCSPASYLSSYPPPCPPHAAV